MAKLNTCIKCHNVYDLNDTSMEQKLIDERFCPRCWKKYIDVEELELSSLHLRRLVLQSSSKVVEESKSHFGNRLPNS